MQPEDIITVPNGKSIHVLHDKCIEWKSLCEFWQTELAFFDKLLRKKELLTDSKYINRVIENLQRGWLGLGTDLSEVMEAVIEYEKYLSSLDQNKSVIKNEKWMVEQRKCKTLVKQFSFEFRSYKKVLFEFAERHW